MSFAPQDLVRALMARDAAGRLGCGAGGGGAVMRHPFLAPVDWDALRAGLQRHLRQRQCWHCLECGAGHVGFCRGNIISASSCCVSCEGGLGRCLVGEL